MFFYSYKSATEFDFDKDKYDIRIPEDLDETAGKKGYKKQERMDQIAPESDYSLRVRILLSVGVRKPSNDGNYIFHLCYKCRQKSLNESVSDMKQCIKFVMLIGCFIFLEKFLNCKVIRSAVVVKVLLLCD